MKFDPRTIAHLASSLQESFPEEYYGAGAEEGVLSSECRNKRRRCSHSHRKRRFINSIFQELGVDMTRRAYRMHAPSFWKLVRLLSPYLDSLKKHRQGSGRGSVGGAKNGLISNADDGAREHSRRPIEHGSSLPGGMEQRDGEQQRG